MFLGDCQTQPTIACLIASTQNSKQFIAAPGCLVEHAAESRSIKEPVISGEPVALAVRQSWIVARRRSRRPKGYGVNRARPFARRRLRTRRPAFVAMRARKPCVRARLILLG